MILREFVNKFTRLVPPGYYKPSTWANYQSHLSKYLVPKFGDIELSSLTPEVLQAYAAELVASGLSSKTCRNIFMTFRVLWKSARNWNYVSTDWPHLMLPRVHTSPKIIFTISQLHDIIRASPEPFNLALWILSETGIRAGELCGLTMEDINVDQLFLRVRQSLWSGRVQTPKTSNAIRQIAISPQLAASLRVYMSSQTAVASQSHRMRFLFTTVRGYPWNPSSLVKTKLHPILDALGLPRTGLHSFRHSSATLQDSANLPLKERQLRLGHADARLTMDTYTHSLPNSDAEKAFVATLGNAISGKVN